MLNLHIYRPTELAPEDLRVLREAGFGITPAVALIVYATKLSTDPNFPEWDGNGLFHPHWRCVRQGHWFVYFSEEWP